MLGFNLDYAKKTGRDLSVFKLLEKLRWGSLLVCKHCRQLWYLNEDNKFINFTPNDRLALIHEWNREKLILNFDLAEKLKLIGTTTLESFGSNLKYLEAPCGIVTKSGEEFEFAILSLQMHAPFEPKRHYRLSDEIREIYSSPYALPYSVRVETSKAKEISMGFAPTFVETPGGELFTLNWNNYFFKKTGYLARDLFVSEKKFVLKDSPAAFSYQGEIQYFIADLQ
jgi:hypothetical protein